MPKKSFHVTVKAAAESIKMLSLLKRCEGVEYPSIESVICEVFELESDDPEVVDLVQRGALEPSRITPAENQKLKKDLIRFLQELGIPAQSRLKLMKEALSRVKYDKPYEEIMRDAEIILRGLAEEELKRLETEKIKKRGARPPPAERASLITPPFPVVGPSGSPYLSIHQLPDGMRTSYARNYFWNNPLFKKLMEGERLLLMLHPFLQGWMAKLALASSPHYVLDRKTPEEILPWEWRKSADNIHRWIEEKWGLSGGLRTVLKELVKDGKISYDTLRAFKLEHLWKKYRVADP